MTARRRLPDRRSAETWELEVGGLHYTVTFGFRSDGTPAEVFLNGRKMGSTADTNARDAAIAASFALQHGADPNALRAALSRNSHGEASGVLGAALDLLAAKDKPI